MFEQDVPAGYIVDGEIVMSSWRVAPSVLALFKQADLIAPNRSKASDGTVSSAKHRQQNPNSDHDPDASGWVYAGDLTDDDKAGIDCREIVRQIVARRDRRVKYLIHEGRMWSSYPATVSGVRYPAWTSRPYNGPNGHFKHLHVSVTAQWRNDTRPWWTPRQAEQEDDEVTADDIKAIAAAVRKEVQKDIITVLRSPDQPSIKSLDARLQAIEKALGSGS